MTDNNTTPIFLSNKADILGFDDRVYARVDTSQWWGGDVLVRSLTAKERNQFERDVTSGKGRNRTIKTYAIQAKLAVITVVDEEKNLLFDKDDIDSLMDKNSAALQEIWRVAAPLSGFGNQTAKEVSENFQMTLS